MVILKEIEYISRVEDNKIIHAPKRQSMKKSKMKCVCKRNSIMLFYREKKRKHSNKHQKYQRIKRTGATSVN